MLNIFVIGYYDRFNLGDDLLGYAINKLLKNNFCKPTITIKNIDDIYQIPKETDIIIFGGGDVFNDYFLDKLINLNKAFNKKVPIYAVSTGLPYKKIGDTGKLDLFDFFYLRTARDTEIVINRISNNYVRFMPDIVFNLDNKIKKSTLEEREKKIKKTIGVCLARTIHTNNIFYSKIIKKIALILNEISNQGHRIILIPFCTGKNPEENDNLINKDIKEILIDNANISLYEDFTEDKVKNIKQMFNLFSNLDLVICSRFHAHVLAMLFNIPFISLVHTSKVNDLLDTYGLNCLSSKYTLDNKNQVTDINELEIIKLFIELNHESKYKCVYNKLVEINKENKQVLEDITYDLIENIKNRKERFEGPKFITNEIINNKIIKCKKIIATILEEEMKININENDLDIIDLDLGNIYNLVTKYNLEENEEIRRLLTQAICYTCTEEYKSIYFYGLYEQIFTKNYNLNSSIDWILKDYYKNSYYNINYSIESLPNVNKIFNLEYIKQDTLKDYHRSGWNYVAYNLGKLNSSDGIWLDMYLDTTFNPANKIYEFTKLIPYKQEWCGFIHHTFDTTYSPNNATQVFENKLFLESLNYCRGIFTLSKYLKKQIEEKLKELNFDNILVCSLVHPTEIPEIVFNLEEYKKNNKIVQIGGWLRNSYAIYELECKTEKYALKGKEMNAYFKPENFNITKFTNEISDIFLGKEKDKEKYIKNELICRHDYTADILESNKYVKGLIKSLMNFNYDDVFEIKNNKLYFRNEILEIIEQRENSVKIIDKLNNDDYDKLLSNHIVFLNLIDASAVNTLIECIVRNTPILINKLDAVVELLGEDYPFYYENIQEANDKIDNINLIEDTYKYMNLYLDKDEFKIEKFLENLVNSDIYKCINEGICVIKSSCCNCGFF